MTTRVVNIYVDEHDLYIGRPSKHHAGPFGNPFVIGRDGTREEVVLKYKRYLWDTPALLRWLPSMRGKRLGCYCAPMACHGDVIKACLDALTDEQIIARAEELEA